MAEKPVKEMDKHDIASTGEPMGIRHIPARVYAADAVCDAYGEDEEGGETMQILIACEESQAVCKEMRRLGHECYSCDIQECSGGHPEWHIMADVIPLLNGRCSFATMDGAGHTIQGQWDMIIAHPPCTYLTVTGNRWFNVERYGDKAIQRGKYRVDAINFFMAFVNADCKKIAIENPIGCMSSVYRRPDQIIHPYMFGDPARKATCLWLKGLKTLDQTNVVKPVIVKYKNGKGTDSPWHFDTIGLSLEERSKIRSKTFPGIARAMAEQWAGQAKEEKP